MLLFDLRLNKFSKLETAPHHESIMLAGEALLQNQLQSLAFPLACLANFLFHGFKWEVLLEMGNEWVHGAKVAFWIGLISIHPPKLPRRNPHPLFEKTAECCGYWKPYPKQLTPF